MAAVISKKYGDGSGNIIAWIDSDVQTNPHTYKPIIEVRIKQDVYDSLHADAKTDLGAVTITDILNTAVS